MVDHSITLSLLSKLNMSPQVLNWLHSYLTDRTQITRVNGKASDPGVLKCGVPQGSILGPLIFILYLNRSPTMLKDSECFMYADDTAIICMGNNASRINSCSEMVR